MSPAALVAAACLWTVPGTLAQPRDTQTVEIRFQSHDGHPMYGKLALPAAPGRHPAIVYVQTAEAMTVDMKRRLGRERTFNYFDIYRQQLPAMDVAFFSYEGRGVQLGETPPRFEQINQAIYDTSTLENKARDLLSAVQAVRANPRVDPQRVFVIGTSEGSVLAAEAAAREPGTIAGLILYSVMADAMPATFWYIMTDGGFLTYRKYLDVDEDGRISQTEFEADPRGYRARALRGAPFSVFDRNGDGAFTSDEMAALTKPYLDAIATENFAVLDAWAGTAAGATTPSGWFRDHFRHPPLWHFLSRTALPVAIFHGTADASTPVAAVRTLEELARRAGKQRVTFHYVQGEDHSLGVAAYFIDGTLPAGHKAIFDWVQRHVASTAGVPRTTRLDRRAPPAWVYESRGPATSAFVRPRGRRLQRDPGHGFRHHRSRKLQRHHQPAAIGPAAHRTRPVFRFPYSAPADRDGPVRRLHANGRAA